MHENESAESDSIAVGYGGCPKRLYFNDVMVVMVDGEDDRAVR